MSKTIYLVRHAKSSWGDASLSDFDRPLNERGKNDAPLMAKKLNERKAPVDAFVSSPAKRARQTCNFFVKEYDRKKKKIHFEPGLYEAGPADFTRVIGALKNKWDHVAIFSHNPGISAFASSLTNTKIDDMPTCAIFAVKANTDDWNEFATAEKEFLFFDYPAIEQA